MPREFARARRVEDQLQRLLVDLIRREVKDPRVGPLTITAVEVTNDFSHARVFVTPFGGQGDAVKLVECLQHAAGFLRSGIRKELRLHTTPALEFILDESIDRAAKVSALINEAVAEDRSHHPEEPGDDDPARR
ncbi:MAG: 30S ribosome-binding factor RbfA [Steroidobacteraceae bacterium]|jgi:ribosome-binding factor A|nr:30S ribosome-binding factor RbfA [Steroidobacteraceae bacterium]MCC7198974.1 30S ribosome-binding factor RbfA [Gammaproteobacteria bacterium]